MAVMQRYRQAQELGVVLDDCSKQRIKDLCDNAAAGLDPACRNQLGIEHYLRQHGIPHTYRQQFGIMVARLKRRELQKQGLPPDIPKRQELVGGVPAQVNLYYEADRPLFDEALEALQARLA